MKLIAIGTIHSRKPKPIDQRNPKSKPKYEDLIAKPGVEFDTDEFGISDDEAAALIARKVVRRKTREVIDDGAASHESSLSDSTAN